MRDALWTMDQAHGLRKQVGMGATRVVPVLSNGRSTDQAAVLAHLAASFLHQGQRALILDADRALVGSWLGLQVRYELNHWLNKECRWDQIMLKSREGLWVMSAAEGMDRIRQTPFEIARLERAFAAMPSFDLCIVVGTVEALHLMMDRSMDEVWMISGAETAHITSTYLRIKAMTGKNQPKRYRMIYKRATSSAQCENAHNALGEAVSRFTNSEIAFAGAVPEDRLMQRAEDAQRTVFSFAPDCALACTFEQITQAMIKRPLRLWSWGQTHSITETAVFPGPVNALVA